MQITEIKRVIWLSARRFAATLSILAILASCGDTDPVAARRTPEVTRAAIRQQYDKYHSDFPAVRGIGVDELIDLRRTANPVLVDVREEKERAVSIIPGAISREVFEAKQDEFRGRPIVAYCTIGYRSGKFVEELNAKGVASLNLEGSILAWVNAGQPVVDPQGEPVRRVHTYGKQWALLPEGFEAVY